MLVVCPLEGMGTWVVKGKEYRGTRVQGENVRDKEMEGSSIKGQGKGQRISQTAWGSQGTGKGTATLAADDMLSFLLPFKSCSGGVATLSSQLQQYCQAHMICWRTRLRFAMNYTQQSQCWYGVQYKPAMLTNL